MRSHWLGVAIASSLVALGLAACGSDASGSPPDIAYLYGSWAPNVAQIPQVVSLGKVVQRPGVNWNDFWVGERDVATVNGKVIGIPALVDNLAVVYNKTLFAQAH